MKNIQEKDIIEKLKLVQDPEIGIDVWTLGLIYKITIGKEDVEILMTLTTPFCPFADELMANIKKQVSTLGYSKGAVRVELTFEPSWEPSAELRLMMGV